MPSRRQEAVHERYTALPQVSRQPVIKGCNNRVRAVACRKVDEQDMFIFELFSMLHKVINVHVPHVLRPTSFIRFATQRTTCGHDEKTMLPQQHGLKGGHPGHHKNYHSISPSKRSQYGPVALYYAPTNSLRQLFVRHFRNALKINEVMQNIRKLLLFSICTNSASILQVHAGHMHGPSAPVRICGQRLVLTTDVNERNDHPQS